MRLKKKYESGAATNYITRGRALKKLQLTLKDFRRLCIFKGIYPHEPLHKKKVNKGTTENRVYYYVKDINFLASEPIINKFREYKIFLRRLTTAKAKREKDRVKNLYERRPKYQLDHIVKERYPTFECALRDLDDALCLIFAFAVLPHTKIITTALVASCQRLAAEFNHYIIESGSLNKVFISIKGIYYEAEVMGERITWVVGHDRGVDHVTEVDFSVMATFVEFYVSMLGFVNFRLYQSIGLFYPPKVALTTDKTNENDSIAEDRVYSLACPLYRTEKHEEQIDANLDMEGSPELNEKLRDMEKRKHLFANCYFWLNREVPKDPLTIIIRSCSGIVSWENCPGALYDQKDARITHQIIDRPVVDGHRDINRLYVQPQWVFDSFNMRKCLPVEKYLPGAILPPHLSPFIDEPASLGQLEQLIKMNREPSNSAANREGKKCSKDQKEKKGPVMRVDRGRMHVENDQKKRNEQGHELKLREMLIPKKRKRVYSKIKRGIKRRLHEEELRKEKKLKLCKDM